MRKLKTCLLFCLSAVFLFASTSCGPTYPKGAIPEAIKKICLKEYASNVEVEIAGKTLAVYLPTESLFDAVFNINEEASKKINGVILGVSRVALSTNQEFNFYIVIAQDPDIPEIELVYIRYVNDVKRFLVGDISRGEYAKRAVLSLTTPSRAEREKVLKNLFEKLNIDNREELLNEYIKEKTISTIDEICYWDNNFYIKEIHLSEFLANQIKERIRISFGTDKDLVKWFEMKGVSGQYTDARGVKIFSFDVDFLNRVSGVYLESGIEFGAMEKQKQVFSNLLGIVSKVLWAYKFEGFDMVFFSIPGKEVYIRKEDVWAFKKRRVTIDELL